MPSDLVMKLRDATQISETPLDLPSRLDQLKESFLHAAARSGMEKECRSLVDLGASISWLSPEVGFIGRRTSLGGDQLT